MKKALLVLVMLLLLIPMTVSAFGRDLWVSLTLNFGTPVTGMTTNDAVYFPDVNGEKTKFLDGGPSISAGFTPLLLSSTTSFGFMGRFSGSYVHADGESNWSGSFSYSGIWVEFSPMVCLRFQVNRDWFINLGAGPSFWKYGAMALDDGGVVYPMPYISSFDGSSGVSPAVYFSINFGWNTIEIGLTGPDVFAGWGVTF